jgi:glycosyltransferase involved in cell wall biosynthesis/predicted Zn-dependent protease
MRRRYLFGPVTAAFADQNLRQARASGECLAFGPAGADLEVGPADTWETVLPRLPPGWSPDFVALYLRQYSVPPGLWPAPIPLVALAPDWDLSWHAYRRLLTWCDLALTDATGVEVLGRQGLSHARAAPLSGCARAFLERPWPDGPRDIDILFAGDLYSAVARETLTWLGRVARLGERWRVVVAAGVGGDEYLGLLGRARVVFHHSTHGECGQHAFVAAAAGALLFLEAGNRAAADHFADRREYVAYGEDLEPLLDYYLTHEDERRALADAARARAQGCSFEALWEKGLAAIDAEWPALDERVRQRPSPAEADALLARTWEALSCQAGPDPALAQDLADALAAQPQSAALHNALGLVQTRAAQGAGPTTAPLAERAAAHFQRALVSDPHHVLAALNLAEALVGIEQTRPAIDAARRLLARLDRGEGLSPQALDAPHFPPCLETFRAEWERAAWENAGRPEAEVRAKCGLLRWRLHALLADLTGDPLHHHEAVLARPDLPAARSGLGQALLNCGRPDAAVPHLRQAVAANPFDRAAARALHQALAQGGDAEGARQLARERLLLARAAPAIIRPEPWFLGAHAPAGAGLTPARPRVSLCLIVKDEEANLPACLGSAAGLVDEVVVVDTGSADGTREVAARLGARVHDFPWCDSFAAARNESLRHARGAWVFWLDADDRLDEENRGKLRALFAGLKDEGAAYVMKCRCLPDPAGGAATVVDHVRLFRNHRGLRWEYRVHEQILPSIRRLGHEVRWADVVVQHTGYLDPGLRRRKLDRDLRLLHLEDAERPDDPFTLFNLGSVYQELGRHAEALPLLRRSLERSQPTDSTVRKLYALVASCHRQLGQPAEALAACRAGQALYPDDAELLFLEGLLHRGQGRPPEAEACWLRLLAGREGQHFGSVDDGLRGYKARHNLAALYHEQGRHPEAEAHWRAAVAERPDFLPGWLGLGEASLRAGQFDELEAVARGLEGRAQGGVEAAVLRARGHLARKDFAAARGLLQGAITQAPQALWPRVILSHVLLQEGRDLAAAEQALRDVLALEPGHAEARNNLSVLLRQRRRQAQDEAFADNFALEHLYRAACATPSDIHEHLPTLYALAGECRHVTEMGTRTGVSTTALLYAQPQVLVCYDTARYPQVDRLRQLAGRTEFIFYQQNVLWAEIEETDLLFIDTWHVYEQLRDELRLHAPKVRKYIVLHDTTTFGERGETEGHRGLWPAVEEFLAEGTFRLKARYENNHGLTVLEAVRPGGAEGSLPAGGAVLPASSLRVAVICGVHNEEDLIVPFLEHYFGLGADAVWLLNNDSTDRTLERARRYPGVTVTDLDSDGQLDDLLRRDALERARAACIGRYDFVILVDADEFVVPKRGGLKDTLARHRDQPALGTEGYDVIQRPGEPAYDPAAPLLGQRRWGVPNPTYGKPVVLRPDSPVRLAVGQHFLEGPRPYPPVCPFYLLHFAGFDEGLFLKRRRQMTARQGDRNIRAGYSVQHTSQTEDDLRRRWRELQAHPRQTLLPVRGEDAPAPAS